MSNNQKAIKAFELLRQSFVRTTVSANTRALQADIDSRIQRYNNMEMDNDPAKQTN